MYRINVVNQSSSGVSHPHTQVITQPPNQSQPPPQQQQQPQQPQQQHNQPLVGVLNQLDAITVSGSNSNIIVGNGLASGMSGVNSIVLSDETIIAAVKAEPMSDIPSTSSTTANGHVIYAPIKRPRLEGYDLDQEFLIT